MGALKKKAFTEVGDLNLSYGDHEIVFHRGYRPKRVVLHANNEYGLPVCHGELNFVTATIIDDGFILHARVRTNDTYILWLTMDEDVI